VSGIPHDIPDFGSVEQAPSQNPAFSPGADFTTEDYFVWSRLDGRSKLREVILMAGLGTNRAIEVLQRLRRMGAVLLPGETAPPKAVVPGPSPAANGVAALGDLSDEEADALAIDVPLAEADRARILAAMRLVRAGDHFRLLGVEHDVDMRALKRAYFRISKEFHPDRYYHQELGPFIAWFGAIFQASTTAFETLSDNKGRAQHLRELGADPAFIDGVAGTQGKEEHAEELFLRACEIEIAGDPKKALPLFAAAVRTAARPAYYRRAARCALAARNLPDAEKFASKAVALRRGDPSYARVLADVYRAADRLEEAERVLVGALQIPSSSDLLVRELEDDLAQVRALRSGV